MSVMDSIEEKYEEQIAALKKEVAMLREVYLALKEIDALKEQIAALTAENKRLREALEIAALAIEIASDWGVPEVQVDPPKEWELEACGEDPADGWCSTTQLSSKLKEIAALWGGEEE